MVIDWMGDFSSQAKVGRAKSPGTPKLWRTPRRWRYSKRNCPIGIRAGNEPGGVSEAWAIVREVRPLDRLGAVWPLGEPFGRGVFLMAAASVVRFSRT